MLSLPVSISGLAAVCYVTLCGLPSWYRRSLDPYIYTYRISRYTFRRNPAFTQA